MGTSKKVSVVCRTTVVVVEMMISTSGIVMVIGGMAGGNAWFRQSVSQKRKIPVRLPTASLEVVDSLDDTGSDEFANACLLNRGFGGGSSVISAVLSDSPDNRRKMTNPSTCERRKSCATINGHLSGVGL